MTILDSIIVIGCVLTLAIVYTVIYIKAYNEAMKQSQAEEEYCPSSEEE
jgi:hypothetical protein